MDQNLKTDCGCQTTCCDRHLAPTQNQASSCCDPRTAAAATSCGCSSGPVEETRLTTGLLTQKRLLIEFLYGAGGSAGRRSPGGKGDGHDPTDLD
jgi:hypothetical protein